MRALKIIGLVAGGLVALLLVVLLAVWLLVNPNDYKGRIAAAVKDSTGRDLQLPGDIKLSVFPWIALELGPASLGNPPGFGAEPFAAVKHAALRVKLLPLLHKELQIGRIAVDGLDLRMQKNANGKGNWEDFGAKDSAAQPAASGSSSGAALQDLAGLVITNSRIAYQDKVLDHLNLDIGHVGTRSAVPVKASLDLTTGRDSQPLHIDSKLSIALNIAAKSYRLAPLQITGTYLSKAGAAPLPWSFSAPDLSLDLVAQSMTAASFSVELAAARIQGTLAGTKVLDAPQIDGSFTLAAVDLHKLMEQLGITPPVTRDARALAKLAARGNFAYGANALRVSKLNVQLDDSTLRGSAGITNLDSKAMAFDLTIDRIDIDRYLGPDNAAAKSDDKPIELPTDNLKALEADGTLAIGALTIAAVQMTDVQVGFNAKGGVTHIAPAKAHLYGGQYSGGITLDDRTAPPQMSIDQTMTAIDVAQLLKDYAKSKLLSGRGNVMTKLSARGKGSDALIKTLTGRVEANLANGAVEGIDIWYEINRAQSLLKQQTLPPGKSTGRTKFDAFKVSADIVGGIATTKDLTITSQQLRVTGLGNTNLVSKAIDYDVKATILKSAPTAGTSLSGLTLAEIPVKITGTMSDPKVRPDLEGMAKARVQQELDKHKDELKQKVQNKLQDLFKH